MLSSDMLTPYHIAIEAYQGAFHSNITRYGITPAKKEEHNEIHESLYGFNSMMSFAMKGAVKNDERTPVKVSPKKFPERPNISQTNEFHQEIRPKPIVFTPELSIDETLSDDSQTHESGPPIYQAGW